MSSSTKSRNFRRRADDDDSNETDAVSTLPTPSTTGRKPSSSSLSSKPKKLLSFADDEEEESNDHISKPKPKPRSAASFSKSKPAPKPQSSSSHKLTSSKDRLPPTLTPTTSNVQPQAGTYTKEALLELQKNTRTLAKPTPSAISSPEPRVILRGIVKPSEEENAKRVGEEEEEEREGEEGIPDEEMIRKIRAKRERLRKARGAAPDYISLEGGSGLGGVVGAIGGGLSEEEEEEELEFRTRVAMIGKKDKGGHGVFEGVVGDEDGDEGISGSVGGSKYRAGHVVVEQSNGGGMDEEDEEDKLWEEEQFRKGLGKRMDDGSGTSRVLSGSSGVTGAMMMQHQQLLQQSQQQRSMMYGTVPSIGGAFGGSYGLDALSIPQQAEIAMKALQDSVMRLKESHDRTMMSLAKADENLSSSLMNITALEKSVSAAGEKFLFMQKLRDFVSVLCEFLQHKAPFIEELEEQMQKLRELRASAVLERRTADNDDEMMEVEAAVKAAMSVFSERGNSAAVIAVAANAAQAASAAIKEKLNLAVELDEFGRDINHQKRMDMKRRAEARHRRRAQNDSKRLSSMDIDGLDQKIEGEYSTDESESEKEAYESNQELLLQTADEIFSDASDEYSQISLVKERFERWMKEYSSSYRDAYVELSAPSIFSPYVRLELFKWDPLHKNTDFFNMKWHSSLSEYGLGSGLGTNNADCNLVPELVEKVAIPILHHEIVHCWDIFSTKQTENAVSATSLVIDYVVPSSSEALTELLVAVRTRLDEAVSALMVPTWNPLILKAVPSAARVAAYRFGISIRLMKSICLWKDILASPVLEKLALDELLCGKVLPHVRSVSSDIHDAVTRTERIIASLSGVWAGPNVTMVQSRKLQPLVDFVLSLGRMLEKKHQSGTSDIETGGLARRLKKMLIVLNDYDNARQISRSFCLKEAL